MASAQVIAQVTENQKTGVMSLRLPLSEWELVGCELTSARQCELTGSLSTSGQKYVYLFNQKQIQVGFKNNEGGNSGLGSTDNEWCLSLYLSTLFVEMDWGFDLQFNNHD